MTVTIILVSLVCSALFSGIEIAYVSANKLRIELGSQRGTLTGRLLASFSKIPSYFIGTLLIGNNIALVIYGIGMAKLLEPTLIQLIPGTTETSLVVLLIQTLVSTILVLLVGEFIPKLLFRINPNGILKVFALPIGLIFLILSPFVALIIVLSKGILKGIFRIKVEESKPVFSKLDLEAFVQEHAPSDMDDQEINTELFQNALYLIKVKARECMVPRPEIQAIDVNSSIDDLTKMFVETNLSRIIVYTETIDNILGYVHHHALLKKPESIKSVLFQIPVIPETMPAMTVLNLFTKRRKTIAWVVDEFGGTAGILTLEDILEEIFGEIEDEHDRIEFVERQLSDNEYIFSARLEVDYLNETYNLKIPEGEYETLGGYIMNHTASIPGMKDHMRIDHFEFTILYASENKIETVKLRVIED